MVGVRWASNLFLSSSRLFRALLEGERRGLQDTNGRMTQQQRERVIGTAPKYINV